MAAARPLTRGERVCAFIEKYCRVPEGTLLGQPMRLLPFQRKFILAVYDNPVGTRKAILSIGRKNGKTGLIAALLLAHIAGPEAVQNSQIRSGGRSREQAALVFKLAVKMVNFSTDLQRLIRVVPTSKILVGLARNVEYQAISAEGKTAHGLSPIVAILDEVGQVRGPHDDFVDAITTAQGAYENPLLFVISTQAPNDSDLLSIWIDDAKKSKDPRIVCHVYAAPEDCSLMDRRAWREANPAMGVFRSEQDIADQALEASRMPSSEGKFRNLTLNQRVEVAAPLISRGTWIANSFEPDLSAFETEQVFCGLDLSKRTDLTAFVRIAFKGGRWHVLPIFWTPEQGLEERSKRDRQPYADWAKQGLIRTTPGASVDYDVVAREIADELRGCDCPGIAFDRWRMDIMKKAMEEISLEVPLVEWGQGFKDMSPAIDELETELLNDRVSHGNNPVLTMCAANAVAKMDEAGGRKLDKLKATGRMDGISALTMAMGLARRFRTDDVDITDFLNNPVSG